MEAAPGWRDNSYGLGTAPEASMSRNYERARVDKRWADSRNTHIAVATAIHAIADSTRTADRIWEDPSPAECDRVKMAVEEYIEHGDFPAAPDGRYSWGCEVVELPASTYTYGASAGVRLPSGGAAG